ncbi:hypothetical protein GRI44_04650 [Altererythrobacter confluentis]|uniref:Lipoprotein n=1 Tax=Allopontixanthobacter confluentis TaxID=1849021 RepID=A0A6L7GEX0_9SPHN|nr:hypothetical protein [Allopontixanthobacter confluentis]MXP14035.1 hypothetical protein [Allopontixanthobacter confluentis]
MRFLVLGAALALSACGDAEISAEEQKRIDDAKIAAVKAAQIIPPTPLTPEPILYPDIEKNDLFGAGCAFIPAGEGTGPLVLTQADVAFMKIDDEIERFAADKGSPKGPVGTYEKYDAGAYSLSLVIDGDGKQSGMETTDFDGNLTVRNERDQTVYSADGLAQCGS